jgi:hypothetical protein
MEYLIVWKALALFEAIIIFIIVAADYLEE